MRLLCRVPRPYLMRNHSIPSARFLVWALRGLAFAAAIWGLFNIAHATESSRLAANAVMQIPEFRGNEDARALAEQNARAAGASGIAGGGDGGPYADRVDRSCSSSWQKGCGCVSSSRGTRVDRAERPGERRVHMSQTLQTPSGTEPIRRPGTAFGLLGLLLGSSRSGRLCCPGKRRSLSLGLLILIVGLLQNMTGFARRDPDATGTWFSRGGASILTGLLLMAMPKLTFAALALAARAFVDRERRFRHRRGHSSARAKRTGSGR